MEQQNRKSGSSHSNTESKADGRDFNSIDPEQIYNVVKDAFGDLNASYSAIRKSALEMIESRPFYALASAAVIGLAAGVAFRNQIANLKTDLDKKEIATH